ncbi:hypothetical protein [Isoptericola aurantiacus]|uniref:hypothetical protein n=1 Tax=Isoptericola aurantiacus TaxID=3377839 RepID=UPI00383A9E89
MCSTSRWQPFARPFECSHPVWLAAACAATGASTSPRAATAETERLSGRYFMVIA